jgi:hypothetical protein
VRYRALSADGDYTFGQGGANFLVDSREMVAQYVMTRLLLWQGEWFLDVTSGTPWLQGILGKAPSKEERDILLRQRILDTPGVTAITAYSSSINAATREFSVSASIDTQFGQLTVEV